MKCNDEILDNEDLFTDEDDKRRVLSLPELQREKILHERFKKIRDSELVSVIKDLDKQVKPVERAVLTRFEDCDFIVPRSLISNNIFKPTINVLKGTFARVGINSKYTICKIVGFKTIERYKLPTKPEENCSIGLIVDTGSKLIEGIQVNSVSSTRITAEEFECFISKFSIETFDGLKKKFQKAGEELSRRLTNAELTKTIENRMADNPRKITNTERKIEIITKRDEAMQHKNKEKALFYQKELEKIEDEERKERKKLFEVAESKRRKAL
ncbi:hypothetical protein GINT2_000589 [Glugoides intestinalis]